MAAFTARMRADPRLRQTWNQVTSNIESANETAQAGIFTFSQQYLTPCFAGVASCVESCVKPCLGNRDERERVRRRRGREGSEYMFDFYDDWDNDLFGSQRSGGGSGGGGGGILERWGNDELDRLLAGSGAVNSQPSRQSRMNYGSSNAHGKIASGKRKASLIPTDDDPATDPNVIPSSSAFGFLTKLPFRFGKKNLRYQPSAADLQDNPGIRKANGEDQPLIDGHTSEEDDVEDEYSPSRRRRRRLRSNTTGSTGSESGSGSFRSRGDLWPSEDEDDAVPLDDEFALPHTNSAEDVTSGRSRRPGGSRTVSHSHTARGTPASRRSRVSSVSIPAVEIAVIGELSSEDLRREEEELKRQQEEEVERKRVAATLLAKKQGLLIDPVSMWDKRGKADSGEKQDSTSNHGQVAGDMVIAEEASSDGKDQSQEAKAADQDDNRES